MIAAEHLFAAQGISATTMRQVVQKARANLGAIHYYFKNKDALLNAVVGRRQKPMDEARIQALDEIECACGGVPPDLKSLVQALIDPLLRFAQQGHQGHDWLRLMVRLRIAPNVAGKRIRPLQAEMFRRFVEAFERALPTLSRTEVAYRVYFLAGTVSHALLETKDLRGLGYDMAWIHDDPWRLRDFLVGFFVSSLQSSAVVATAGAASEPMPG